MKIRIGYEMVYSCPQPTPMLMTLNVHSSRVSDLINPDYVHVDPSVPMSSYRDGFGNWITRIMAPEGDLRIYTDALINDPGVPAADDVEAQQHLVEDLPDDVLVYLLGSRYCETDILVDEAWRLFANAPFGWKRVQAICDFVHQHITFGYEFARATKTAAEAYKEKVGVCRDYTHLAVALCRCMNIPARYCTGYVSFMSNPLPHPDMDFAAWFEAYLDGSWHTFDPRNNKPMIGRILMAQGRDASDVALSTAFGPNTLKSFKVHTDEQKLGDDAPLFG